MADDLRRDREVVVGDRRSGRSRGASTSASGRRPSSTWAVGMPKSIRQAISSTPMRFSASTRATQSSTVPNRPRVLEVALEGELEHAVDLLLGQRREVELHRVADARRLLEGREGPGVLLDQRRGAAQVVLHRLARDLAHRLAVGADEGVQHQRHLVLAPGRARRPAAPRGRARSCRRPPRSSGRAGGSARWRRARRPPSRSRGCRRS